MIARQGRAVLLLLLAVTLVRCAAPPPAAALNPVKPICSLAGLVSTLAGKVCSAAASPGRVLGAGKQLLGGHLGGALESLAGGGASPVVKGVAAAAGIAAIGAWVAGGAKFALHETESVIATTTRPELQSTWFSSAYWRMAAISALLTLPFLFAAAIQAIMRSDLALLVRAALGYLPLAMLAVGVAAPVTTLLLAASDEMSGIVSSASNGASSSFLAHAGAAVGFLSAASRSPFLAFFVGLITAAATLTLWIELLIRSAAVYVIVLMLPLFFAALVWPARRIWAVRTLELLVALILSKFAIVAVLALGGAALGHTSIPSVTTTLAGATLVLLAAFSPWALLRMLPLHELASGAASGLRSETGRLATQGERGMNTSDVAQEIVRELPGELRRRDAREGRAAQAALEALAAESDGAVPPDGRGADGGAANGIPDAQPGGGASDAGHGADGAPVAAPSAQGSGPGSGGSGPAWALAPTLQTASAPSEPSGEPSGEQSGAGQEPHPNPPGLYQSPHNSARTMSIDPAEWPPQPLDYNPPSSRPAAADTDGPARSGDSDGGVTGEDHDPRPPRQEPDEGRL